MLTTNKWLSASALGRWLLIAGNFTLKCVGTLILCPYMAGGRSRRGSPKAGTTLVIQQIHCPYQPKQSPSLSAYQQQQNDRKTTHGHRCLSYASCDTSCRSSDPCVAHTCCQRGIHGPKTPTEKILDDMSHVQNELSFFYFSQYIVFLIEML